MIWVGALLVALVVAAFALVLTRPMRIPRDPAREGFQDAEASGAYDQVSCWPIYAFERHIVVSALAREDPCGTLLDIGCGPGHLTAAVARRFPRVACFGLDINEHMLALARRRFRAVDGPDFVGGDVGRLPFASGSVDIIISSLSLHHWKTAGAALTEIGRVLTPGGLLVLFDLRRDCPRWLYFVFVVGQALFLPAAIRRTNGAVGSIWASFTAAELANMLREAGFPSPRLKLRFGWLLARSRKPHSRSSSLDGFTANGSDGKMNG
jgi:ubiquinone/menaquinone biosynthesis C-methylase UbiE